MRRVLTIDISTANEQGLFNKGLTLDHLAIVSTVNGFIGASGSAPGRDELMMVFGSVGISERTMSRNLSFLVESGMLERSGAGNSTGYSLGPAGMSYLYFDLPGKTAENPFEPKCPERCATPATFEPNCPEGATFEPNCPEGVSPDTINGKKVLKTLDFNSIDSQGTKEDQGKKSKSQSHAVDDEKPRRSSRKGESPEQYIERVKAGFREIDEDADLKAVWKESFPALDVRNEMVRAYSWCITHLSERKKDFRKFMNTWLVRSADRRGYRR